MYYTSNLSIRSIFQRESARHSFYYRIPEEHKFMICRHMLQAAVLANLFIPMLCLNNTPRPLLSPRVSYFLHLISRQQQQQATNGDGALGQTDSIHDHDYSFNFTITSSIIRRGLSSTPSTSMGKLFSAPHHWQWQPHFAFLITT